MFRPSSRAEPSVSRQHRGEKQGRLGLEYDGAGTRRFAGVRGLLRACGSLLSSPAVGRCIAGRRQINAPGSVRRATRARSDLVADRGRQRVPTCPLPPSRTPRPSFSGEQRGTIGDAYGGVNNLSGANLASGFRMVSMGDARYLMEPVAWRRVRNAAGLNDLRIDCLRHYSLSGAYRFRACESRLHPRRAYRRRSHARSP